MYILNELFNTKGVASNGKNTAELRPPEYYVCYSPIFSSHGVKGRIYDVSNGY
jgi:hypothetical protein